MNSENIIQQPFGIICSRIYLYSKYRDQLSGSGLIILDDVQIF